MSDESEARIVGSLLGTAVGDALGLPYEGVSRRRAAKLLGPPDRHRLIFRLGMISDDTEHTIMVAQSLIACGGDLGAFATELARRMRWWLLTFPAGIGRATLRAILKLWLGACPASSGVFSAGNGPSMRSAIVGAAINDPVRMAEYVTVSTRITHSDPKAEFGAIAVALAAFLSGQEPRVDPQDFVAQFSDLAGSQALELIELLRAVQCSVDRGQSTQEFADTLGLTTGVSGYTYDTVPIVIHAWLRNQDDYRTAVTSVIACGGDTDTTAAIVGGIVGARVGKVGIPRKWLRSIVEWPTTVTWMERLAHHLSKCNGELQQHELPELSVVGVCIRNLVFLVVVLLHVLRRLLPPY